MKPPFLSEISRDMFDGAPARIVTIRLMLLVAALSFLAGAQWMAARCDDPRWPRILANSVNVEALMVALGVFIVGNAIQLYRLVPQLFAD